MAKTPTKPAAKPAATAAAPAAGSAPKAPRPMTPTQRAERAESAERDRLRSMTEPVDQGVSKLLGRIGQQVGDLEIHLGPAGPRPTTAPGAAPMAPRVAVPAAQPSTKPGRIGTAIAAALVLLGLLAGLAISQFNWEKVEQFAPTKVEQVAPPAKKPVELPPAEQKSSVEQPAKLADRLDLAVNEPILPLPAEEQVAQASVDEQLLVDVKIRCEGLADRIPVDKMSAAQLQDLMSWCEAARSDLPPPPAEQQPAEQQVAGMYQSQQQYAPPQRPGQRQGTPRCPAGSVFRPEYGKCVGTTLHDIPLNSGQRAYLASSVEIETRLVQRGNRLVQQQRCKRP